MIPQQRASKTRAENKALKELYETVTKPAHRKVEVLLNKFLKRLRVRVKWVGPWRLKHGVISARLLAINHGGLGFTVLIDGYKRKKHYSSSFWEL